MRVVLHGDYVCLEPAIILAGDHATVLPGSPHAFSRTQTHSFIWFVVQPVRVPRVLSL